MNNKKVLGRVCKVYGIYKVTIQKLQYPLPPRNQTIVKAKMNRTPKKPQFAKIKILLWRFVVEVHYYKVGIVS